MKPRWSSVFAIAVAIAASALAQSPPEANESPGAAYEFGAYAVQTDDPQALSAGLEARLNAMQAEIDDLRGRPPGHALEEGRMRSTDVPRVEDLRQTPAFPKVKLTGFFHADAGWFHQSPASFGTFGDINDATGFRRARLAAVGDVADNVGYMLEMDFAFPGRPSFMDVWLDVHDVALLGNVRVGQWRQPFMMDAMNSVRELMFLERPLSFAFVPFRQVGIGFHNNNQDETVTWAFSGFRFPTDPFGGIGTPGGVGGNLGDQGYGLAGRITALLIEWDDCSPLLHVGGDYAYLVPGTGLIDYRNTPEFGGPFVGAAGNLGSVPFFVDTGSIPTENIHLYNAELAVRWRSWYAQAEATYAMVNDTAGNVLSLPGAYAQMGYFLTGEVRPYNRPAGVFGRVKPLANFGAEGFGAWELAARYSYLNLDDVSTLGPTNPGGQLSDLTFGVNWYLNQYTKFQFNYIHAFLDRPAEGKSETGIYALRAQLDF